MFANDRHRFGRRLLLALDAGIELLTLGEYRLAGAAWEAPSASACRTEGRLAATAAGPGPRRGGCVEPSPAAVVAE